MTIYQLQSTNTQVL